MEQKALQNQIDQLNSDAWTTRVNDSNRAVQLSERAIQLAEPILYKKGLAEGLRTLGFGLIRLSRHDEALQYLEKALVLFKELDDLRGESDVYEYFGIIRRSLGLYEESLDFIFKALLIRQQTGYAEGESLSLYHLGVTFRYLGDYEQALDYFLKSLAVGQAENFWISESYTINNIGLIYLENGDYPNALNYFYQSLSIRRKSGDKWGESGCLDNIGVCQFKLKETEKALDFCTESFEISKSTGDVKGQSNSLFHLGNIYEQAGQFDKAFSSYDKSLQIRKQIADKKGEAEIMLFLAELYANEKIPGYDIVKATDLMNEALALGNETKANDLLSKIHHGFYELCKKNRRHEEALVHLETYIKTEKELHTAATNQKILNLEISHRVEKSRKETEMYKLRNIELANLYEEIKKQKEETEVQKIAVDRTLAELKAAQALLIQSEKMASLGELTAGIAHEIQNPLNFVNNFSEVNSELVDELQYELKSGKIEDAILISNDIKKNEQKINFHGRRADAIVKGMLQHSRVSSGQKDLTNINALVDEYFSLAYHGLRAKDKSFNAKIETDFDPLLPKINVVPQDIGRALLNLINNAFYACSRRSNIQQGEGDTVIPIRDEPTVWVTTKKIGNEIEIRVKDNGNGIPESIRDKIFQPFFTTKPTGAGTGLGLSLTYEIIKTHGGEIKVETKENEGSTFIIQLPLS